MVSGNPEGTPTEGVVRLESLEDGRNRIDEIDEKLLALLNERATVAVAIASIKRRDHISGPDLGREFSIIEKIVALNQGPLTDRQVANFFFNLFAMSREVQQSALQTGTPD